MDQYQTRRQRREIQREKAVARTSTWRADRAAAGIPDARAVDRAIAEATAFLMRLAVTEPVMINTVELIRLAKIILVRDGHERAASKASVVARLRPRKAHTSSTHMPGTALTTPEPPRGGNDWHPLDLKFGHELAARARRQDASRALR